MTIRSGGSVKLFPGEEPLKPRLRIICDEHLSGAPRDGVQARLELWLKSHIERVLEPLFRLAAADDVTGIARGVAYQLIEALGVLDRPRIADEVKGLDQPARATLRKYGVRFGAYHIYVPGLLKPAPRVLATQLWALKHGGSETKGLEAIEQLAASGRTSIAADKDFNKVLYRTAGYRVCGERAVRVDILERLADLIRPALAWRAGAIGTKPPGAIDGFGFTVAVGMTSLAGCSGEDFASVLRSLGYRMEKRPKPAEPPPASAQSASEGSNASAQAVSLGDVSGEVARGDEAHSAAILNEAGLMPQSEMEMKPPDAPIVEQTAQSTSTLKGEPPEPADRSLPGLTAQEAASEMINVPEAPALATSEYAERSDSQDQSVAVATTMEVATTELIEVWRPIRRDEQRSQHREQAPRRRRPRRGANAPPSTPGAEVITSGEGGTTPTAGGIEPSSTTEASSLPEAREEGRQGRHVRRDRREGSDQLRSPRPGRPDRRQPDQRMERADRVGRSQPGERPGRQPRADRPDRDPALRAKYIKGRGEGGAPREREPDPNSPFAKLSKLKEELEASAKEPR
jgi:ATP-dependent RNA helicase SUPV3L1/SUV3